LVFTKIVFILLHAIDFVNKNFALPVSGQGEAKGAISPFF